ncbi:hypothetical protein KSD_16290 [Ktedonobacter sp. SOSP1-85]|nr:hypothetical protein KSD_16290 [Ktedonobacter sp. SOSP1-85]
MIGSLDGRYGRTQTTPQADIYSLGALLFCKICISWENCTPKSSGKSHRWPGSTWE